MKRPKLNLAIVWGLLVLTSMSVTPTFLRNLEETRKEWEEYDKAFHPHHSPLDGSRMEPSPPSHSPAAGTISGATPAFPSATKPVEPKQTKAPAPESLRSGTAGASREAPEQTRGNVDREWHRAFITFYCKTCNTPRNSTQTSSGIPLKEGVVNFAAPKQLRHLMGKTLEVRFRGNSYIGRVTDKCGTQALDVHDGTNWTTKCKCYSVGYGEWRIVEAN